MDINNLKIRKGIFLTVLGLSIFSLNKIDAKAICKNEIEITQEDEYFLFQKYERDNKEEEFVATYKYYAVEIGNELPVDSELTKYMFLGNLDLETISNVLYGDISNNYIDCAYGNFIDKNKLCKECFKDVDLISFDDTINRVVSSDGTVLGYTPKKKIYIYN